MKWKTIQKRKFHSEWIEVKKRSNLRDKSFFHYAFNQKWFRGGISMQSKEQQWTRTPSKGFNSKATLFKRLLHSRQKMSPLEFHFEFGHLFFFKNCTNRCPKLDCWFYGPLEIRVETKFTNVLNFIQK